MKPGDVIEFDAGEEYLLGVITRELGQKYIVVTEEGDEMRPSGDEITRELGSRIDSGHDTETIASRLQTHRNEIDATADEVDVGFLWEFVSGDRVTAEELSELFFESSETAEVMAVQQKLRDNDLYFKDRGGEFEPRSENQVEEMRRQLEAKRKERQRREGFVDGVVEILEADEEDRQEVTDEKMGDHQGFAQFVHTLQDFAIYDRDYDQREEALELLEAIEEKLDRQIQGRYGRKAFWLMVEMGVWDEHENLWLHQYNLGGEPDEEVVEAIEEIEREGWEPESWRRDLTDRRCFSIDDASTRDIDDALSCRRKPDGGWEVGVHIADPSEFVEAGDPLDEHARKRGTSIYLPWTTIPMFPPRMSEEIASLVAGKKRPAISVLLEFDEQLRQPDYEVVPSVVEVDDRLTYEQADALLEEEGDDRELAEALGKLGQLADECKHRRKENGAISVDLPDPDVRVEWNDGEPTVDCGVKERGSPSDEIVSEFMIQANTLLGKFCRSKGIPVIFRTQESPDREVLDEEVKSTPEGIPRQFAMIYKMKPGNLTTEPDYHFGLGVTTYTQATSPIRRYADLICQRQIKAFLADEELPHDEDEMVQLLGRVESASREAGRTQSETERYWLLEYLRRREEPLEATVVQHKNNDGTHASVWLEGCAQKFNCNFRKKVPVGETTEVVVEKANPRRDSVSLKQK